MAVVCVEGINQSGKSTYSKLLMRLFGYYYDNGVRVKLPNYDFDIGQKVLHKYLPATIKRPSDLVADLDAQLALFALNRLEVLAEMENIGIDVNSTNVVVDRSPFSSFHTYIDALLTAQRNGCLEEILQKGQINRHVKKIIEKLARQQGRETAVLDEDEIRTLYSHAVDKIRELEGYYFEAIMNEARVVILDLPISELRERRIRAGKALDAQEETFSQSIVRQLYIELANQNENVDLISQVVHQEGQVHRLSPREILREIWEVVGNKMRVITTEGVVGELAGMYSLGTICEGTRAHRAYQELMTREVSVSEVVRGFVCDVSSEGELGSTGCSPEC